MATDIIRSIEKIQSGDNTANYVTYLSCSDQNLIEVFRCIGCDISKRNPGKRILFTNYCLGYRRGSESGGMNKKIMSMDKELFDDLVIAVNPKVIICLGKITYESVIGHSVDDFVVELKKGVPFETEYPNNKGIRVYGVAHPGSLGSMNVGGLDVMRKIWKRIMV